MGIGGHEYFLAKGNNHNVGMPCFPSAKVMCQDLSCSQRWQQPFPHPLGTIIEIF